MGEVLDYRTFFGERSHATHKVTVLLCALTTSALGVSRATALPTAEELIKQMQTKLEGVKTLSADLSMTIPPAQVSGTGHGIGARLEKDGKVTRQSFTEFTMKMKGRRGEQTMTVKTVNDGQYVWQEMRPSAPAAVRVMKMKPEQMTSEFDPLKQTEELNTGFDLKVTAEDSIDGQKMYVLEGGFRPEFLKQHPEAAREAKAFSKVSIFVGQDDHLIHRVVALSPKGEVVGVMDLSNIKLNEKTDPDLFSYAPPPGAQFMDMTQGTPQVSGPGDE